MKKDKALIEYKKESIFSKIINFFKNKFFKKSNIINNQDNITHIQNDSSHILDNNITQQNDSIINKTEITAIKEKNKLDSKTEKERFFKLYNDFKNDKIEAKDICLYDLLRIMKLLKEEEQIYLLHPKK